MAQTSVGQKSNIEHQFKSNLEIDPVIKKMDNDEIKKIILRNERKWKFLQKN